MQAHNGKQYKIVYRDCIHSPDHVGEKMNMVCLNQSCTEESLICSLCREEKHKGHQSKPLKFYIEELRTKYESDPEDFNLEINKLEEARSLFLTKLKNTVIEIAESFRKLEEDVMEKFNLIREQIIEEQSRQNKFTTFYESLLAQSEDRPEFLIQNYLPKEKIGQMDNWDVLESLQKTVTSMVLEAKGNLTQKRDSACKNVENAQFILPKTVLKEGNVFTQTSTFSNQGLCVLPLDVLKNFQNVKLKVKILNLKTKGKSKGLNSIYLGVLGKSVSNSLNLFSFLNLNNDKVFSCCQDGTIVGKHTGVPKSFSEHSSVNITFVNETMKISIGKCSLEFILPKNEEFYFFFNLIGDTKVEFALPSK